MDYHNDHRHVTKTGLTLFAKSRLEYYHTYVTELMPKRIPTQPMLIGTVLHSVLLEGKAFDELVACYTPECFKSNNTLHPQKAAEFRSAAGERTCVKESEYEELASVCGTVSAQLKDFISRTDTKCEQVFTSENIHGMPAKCKPDAVRLGMAITCLDLKFGKAIDPASFRRSSRNLKYWLQDAHYSAVLQSLYPDRYVGFEFIAIEVEFPYRVQRYKYDEASRDTGRAEHMRLMKDLARCHESGDWSDGWDGTLVLEPWDVQSSESELVEVDT